MSTTHSYPSQKAIPLADGTIDLVARRFGVLADPLRLRLIRALFPGERSVSALVIETGSTQANVSRHLRMLMLAGVIDRRKEGLQVFYTISDPSIKPLCEIVCGTLERQLRSQAEAFTP